MLYKNILIFFFLFNFWKPNAPLSQIGITIDPTAKFQAIEGWGGHFYPQAYQYFLQDSTFAQQSLHELKTTHVRVRSYWYLLEGYNDNYDPSIIDWNEIALGDTGIVHDELLMQQFLFRHNFKLLFAAWRFPYWMVNQPPDWQPKSDEKPALPLNMDSEFIESIAAYLLYARDKYGIHFEAVSIANEPDIGIYIKGLNPERLLRLTKELKFRLENENYYTKYYLPDVAAADSISMDYTEDFFKIGNAADNTVAVSYHSYRREKQVIEFYANIAKKYDLPVWVTEQNHTHLAAPDRHEWSHGLKNAVCLHDILVYGNASLSIYFSYAMANSNGLTIFLPEKWTWAPAYHMLKHFYNHIPPGSVRIETVANALETGIRSVAFIQPDQQTIALVLINDSKGNFDIHVSVKDYKFKMIEVRLSNQLNKYEVIPPPSTKNDINLSSESVVTAILQLSF